MTCEQLVKFCCLVLLLGSVESKCLNITGVHEPIGFARPFDLEPCSPQDEGVREPAPDTCDYYYECYEGEWWDVPCPDGSIFDRDGLACVLEEEYDCVILPPTIPDQDDECPPAGSDEVRFLPSLYCDEFYICINGQPVLLNCRPGQHWNAEQEFCDEPWKAGCYEGINPPNQLPECAPGFRGQHPHPHNCNWFIHCDNGNRSIQQCQHLHHFDVVQNRCLFQTAARCIKHAGN